MSSVPKNFGGLQYLAGSYSPPSPLRNKRRSINFLKQQSYNGKMPLFRRASFTSRASFSDDDDELITKPILKRILKSSTLDDVAQLASQNTTHFTIDAIDWLCNWASNSKDDQLAETSAATLAHLAFPVEKIPQLRDKIFQNSLIKIIIRVAVENSICLAHHIEKDEFEIQERIAGGSGGQIYSAIYDRQNVVVKFFKKNGCWYSSEKEFFYESTIISLFGSFKNFISCHGVNFKEAFIVMPLASNLSLDDMLTNGALKQWNWKQKITMITQIASSMRTLHRYGIIHRDLKSANILVDEAYNCYLADFGISISHKGNRKRSMTMNVGTSMYMAPEVIEGDGQYCEQIDVFSFSVLVWQIVSNCSAPYLDQGMSLNEIPSFVCSGSRLEIPKDCPNFLAAMITKCWHNNPKKRPSFKQILYTLREAVDVDFD